MNTENSYSSTGEIRIGDEAPGRSELDNERTNDFLLELFSCCEDLTKLNDSINQGMRKGFLQMARARQTSGMNQLSVLNCRAEFLPFVTIEMNEHALNPVQFCSEDKSNEKETIVVESIYRECIQNQADKVSDLWQIKQLQPESPSTFSEKAPRSIEQMDSGLRRRARGLDNDGGLITELSAGSRNGQTRITDSLQLFGGLVPQPLRKAKNEFRTALDSIVTAANKVHKIQILLQQINARSPKTKTDFVKSLSNQNANLVQEAENANFLK